MARTRTAKHPQPEAVSADVAEPKPPISQVDAIRAALDAGHEKPKEGVKYIEATFGIHVSPTYFSVQKGKRAKSAVRVPVKRGRRARGTVEGYLAPPRIDARRDGDLLNAMAAIKPLIASLGAEKVKKIVDLLS